MILIICLISHKILAIMRMIYILTIMQVQRKIILLTYSMLPLKLLMELSKDSSDLVI